MLKKIARNIRLGYYPKYLQNILFKTVESDNSFNPFEIAWSKFYLNDYWLKDSRNCKVHWLHNLNQIRIPAIYEAYFAPNDLYEYTKLEPREEFKKMKILDVGCGGGICSAALAQLNFDVTGIDPNPDMIVIAKNHAQHEPLLYGKQPKYYHTTIEDFYQQNLDKFDAVVISEVLERIPHHKKRKFLQKCINCVKTNGDVFITARNRTIYSFWLLISFTLSNRLEPGHHSWHNGISTYLLKSHLTSFGCTIKNIRGFTYQGHSRGFAFRPKTDGWYFVHAVKNKLIIQS